jgi:cell division protein FtsA
MIKSSFVPEYRPERKVAFVGIEAQLFGSLDMGTTKISAMIGEKRGDRIRIIGVGTTTSEGLRQGVVVDIDKAASSIDRAVREAEHMAGTTMRRFNVGIAGEHIRSMNSRGVVAILDPENEITGDDVNRALGAARNFALPEDREILHTLPQEFIIDNQGGIRQASGMYGSRLEARVHIVTALRPALDNIVKALNIAAVDMVELVLEPLASSYAVLAEDEREIGVMLIDIGGGTSDVMIFSDRGVLASGVIGVGGSNITSDIAYGLRTAMRSAEEIKIQHGCALSSMVSASEKIEVSGVGLRESRQVARQLLSAIIEPRVTELFTLINDQVTRSQLKSTLGAGIVLTGGSSMLAGTRELAEQIFELPVRVGNPLAVDGLVEVVSHPMYATGVGLLLIDNGYDMGVSEKPALGKWWRQSIAQLRRAIASFI